MSRSIRLAKKQGFPRSNTRLPSRGFCCTTSSWSSGRILFFSIRSGRPFKISGSFFFPVFLWAFFFWLPCSVFALTHNFLTWEPGSF